MKRNNKREEIIATIAVAITFAILIAVAIMIA